VFSGHAKPATLLDHDYKATKKMSDFEASSNKVAEWLQPRAEEGAPCGPDLEYDNDFLALNQAVAGKPETQFAPAEAPDWRAAFDLAETLLDRSRDLRIAIVWLRAGLHLHGFGFLPPGLRLLSGFIESMWDHVHPLPDPDDGDPYARVNALTLLREQAGLLGDVRATKVINDRAVGVLTAGAIEVALGLAAVRSDEAALSRDQVSQMVNASLDTTPELRAWALDAQKLARELTARITDKLGASDAPDLKPLVSLLAAVASVLPAEAGAQDDESAEPGAGAGGPRRGLAGAVTTRDEAIRAIDMVCAYLEAAEPTNPAPLFLRRARQLLSHNFLQLMKELAPDAMNEVARIVGVDADSVQTPGSS
jgi:type VI secretion system protein ImpA